jgi:hypothetical protein
MPPDGVEERQLVPEDGRHASTVGSGPSSSAHDCARPPQEVLKRAKAARG